MLVCATCGTAQGYGGPADDAREKGLAAYDALNMREKSEIAAQHPRYCYAKGYVAALAGRADDASGAEAMGIPGLDFQSPRDRTPKGYTRVEAYMGQGYVVVMGYPTDESHSCDALGCGSTGAHVIARLPLPAPDDAVEEARKVVDAASALLKNRGATYTVDTNPPVEFVMIPVAYFNALRAALRRAKGGSGG